MVIISDIVVKYGLNPVSFINSYKQVYFERLGALGGGT